MRAKWTEEEVELFKRAYPVKTSEQMKELFPQYTWQQMLTKAQGLDIKKGKEVIAESRRQNLSYKNEEEIWSDEDKKILLELYPIKGFKGVFEGLGGRRSMSGIERMVRRLKLKRKQNHLMWEQQGFSMEYNENGLTTKVTYKGW